MMKKNNNIFLTTFFWDKRNEKIEIPNEFFNGSDYQNFKQTDFCGESHWQLNVANVP
jgi:hypothetical protein